MCDILNNNIEIESNNKIFEKKKIVQISNFIKNDTRMKILTEILTKGTNYKKINNNDKNLTTIVGASLDRNLYKIKHDDMEHNIKLQYNLIDGSDIQTYFPDLHYYYHNCIADIVSKIIGIPVYPVNEANTINNSLLIYENENDSIRWHTDKSMFNGKKVYTVLVYLYNDSSQNLCYIHFDNKQKECVFTDVNSCIILEQFHLEHMVTPIKSNEKKIAWSMIFAEDVNLNTPKSYIFDKIKNIGFIGIRALNIIDYSQIIFSISVIIIIIYFILNNIKK
jgi:hypothetical protein